MTSIVNPDIANRIRNDHKFAKLTIEDLMRKFRLSEAQVLEVLDSSNESKAVKAFTQTVDMYYGSVRSDAVKHFEELLNE